MPFIRGNRKEQKSNMASVAREDRRGTSNLRQHLTGTFLSSMSRDLRHLLDDFQELWLTQRLDMHVMV